ncbi:MAG TPA: hypothetical protein VK879_07615 [Candidatus Sulfomarinibacteraceae bacterium]|nr:hypothetical protein [Candidatus Sulfomarinibacteraceae bacterium]
MDYGKTLSRSATIVWENKYLILLGILAALGSGSIAGGGGGGGGGGSNGSGNGQPFTQPGQFPDFSAEIGGLAVGVILALICVALFVGILLWAISAIARGGLIASVDTIESGGKSSFTDGWRAGWQKVWTLLGIGLLPGIPGLILFAIGLLALTAYGGVWALVGEDVLAPAGVGLGAMFALLACIVLPIALLLSILRTFAERACMLEDLGVIDAYRRGWNVLAANLGEAIVLFVLQIVIFLVLGAVLFVPGLFLLLCCLLWPILFVVQGAITAFVSALWTLAWREWTGLSAMVEKAPKPAL